MKSLWILLGAVGLLLATWLVVGLLSKGGQGPAPLFIPQPTADRPTLIRAANQLWLATPGHYAPSDCVRLMALLADSLGDGEWPAVSGAVLFAWKNLRQESYIRSALAALNQKLIPRFARSGTMSDLQGLILAANERSFDASAINEALATVARIRVASGGFERSRLADLVAAAASGHDYKRARELLEKIAWESKPDDLDQGAIERVRRLVAVCEAGDRARYDLAEAIRVWRKLEADAVHGGIFRALAEDVGLQVLRTFDVGSEAPTLEEIYALSSAEPSGEEYWERLVRRFWQECAEGKESKNRNLAIILPLYESQFKRRGYAWEIWMKTADLAARRSPEDPLLGVKLYERALAAAPGDPERVNAKGASTRICIPS